MRDIKFELKENSRAGKVYIQVEYSGGDADIEIYEEYSIDNTTFESPETFVETPELNQEIDFFNRLSSYLDDHASDYDLPDDQDLIDEYGEDVFKFACEYGGVPGDATVDYQFSCRIGGLRLLAYDQKGNKFESYI